MQKYYFTFGGNHFNNDGDPLGKSHVVVEASGYSLARRIFIAEYASKELPRPDAWSWQYEEKIWDEEVIPTLIQWGIHSVEIAYFKEQPSHTHLQNIE